MEPIYGAASSCGVGKFHPPARFVGKVARPPLEVILLPSMPRQRRNFFLVDAMRQMVDEAKIEEIKRALELMNELCDPPDEFQDFEF